MNFENTVHAPLFDETAAHPSVILNPNQAQNWKTVDLNSETAAIPSDWSVKTLSESFSISGGGTPSTKEPAYWGGGIPWVGPRFMGNDQRFVQINHTNSRTLTDLGAKKVADKITPRGSLIVSSRAPVGYANMAPCDLYTNQGCYSFTQSGDGICDFLYFWIRKNRTLLESRASGTTFLEISRSTISRLQFASPPTEEQALIARILTTQESQIFTLRGQAALERERLSWLAEELLSGRIRVSQNEEGQPILNSNSFFKTITSNGLEKQIPEEWMICSFSELGGFSTGKDYKKNPPGDTPVYGSSSTPMNVSVSGSLHPGETFMIGRKGTIDRPHFVSEPFWCVDTAMFFNGNTRIDNKYAFWIARFSIDWKFYNAGTTLPSLTQSAVNAIQILTPPYEEQLLIAHVLSSQECHIEDINRLANFEQQRFDWLSSELLSGRIRIRSDE